MIAPLLAVAGLFFGIIAVGTTLAAAYDLLERWWHAPDQPSVGRRRVPARAAVTPGRYWSDHRYWHDFVDYRHLLRRDQRRDSRLA